MESVWLPLGSGLRGWSGRSGWVFLARGGFAVKTPPMKVGFPWILSSESRLFNGLRSLKRGIFFSAPFRGVTSAGKGAGGRGHAEAQDCSWRKLNPVPDFLQEIVVRAVPLRPPQSKSSSLWRMVTAPLEDEVLALYPADRFHNQHQFCALRSCPGPRAVWTLGARRQQGPHWSASGARSPKKARRPAECRVREILRHEGWRPSACQNSKPDRVVSSERISAGRHLAWISFP